MKSLATAFKFSCVLNSKIFLKETFHLPEDKEPVTVL
jgi:hypothetical protein